MLRLREEGFEVGRKIAFHVLRGQNVFEPLASPGEYFRLIPEAVELFLELFKVLQTRHRAPCCANVRAFLGLSWLPPDLYVDFRPALYLY